ncbi:hypothetical protein TSAR_014427 [Trichomalopsis sarcophagae]|uniref:Uncharacterized protein n=1 Tax=Trichomalopsis sarcophagae TaxID=543379 RepID=A0A232FE25_9HYME|nr:hypothetical protein TSAR_014427 [Trichomalopsis sarcophagae]
MPETQSAQNHSRLESVSRDVKSGPSRFLELRHPNHKDFCTLLQLVSRKGVERVIKLGPRSIGDLIDLCLDRLADECQLLMRQLLVRISLTPGAPPREGVHHLGSHDFGLHVGSFSGGLIRRRSRVGVLTPLNAWSSPDPACGPGRQKPLPPTPVFASGPLFSVVLPKFSVATSEIEARRLLDPPEGSVCPLPRQDPCWRHQQCADSPLPAVVAGSPPSRPAHPETTPGSPELPPATTFVRFCEESPAVEAPAGSLFRFLLVLAAPNAIIPLLGRKYGGCRCTSLKVGWGQLFTFTAHFCFGLFLLEVSPLVPKKFDFKHGVLDNDTAALMSMPRCGVKDRVGASSDGRSKRYALQDGN